MANDEGKKDTDINHYNNVKNLVVHILQFALGKI